MNRTFLSLLTLLGMLHLASADSALRWDKKTVELQPGPGEKTARADFNFTNVSKQPVAIDSVKPSCGCTTAALEKKTYQPGEKGHITAVFTIGSHRGVQNKGISVAVHGEREPTVLMMVTHVGEPMKIDPSLVAWRTGETAHAKTITVRLPATMGVRLTKVSCSDPKMTATLETVKEGTEYRVIVTPADTAQKTMATVNIQGVMRSNEPKTFQAYAQVR